MTTTVGQKRVKYSDIIKLVALTSGLLISSWVQALHFEPGDEVKIDVDTTLAYGAMWRVQSQDKGRMTPSKPIGTWTDGPGVTDDPAFIDAVLKWNSDDGNRNFDKGDMVSNRVAATSDMDLKYHNLGFFLRGQIFYDSVYFEQTAWDGKGWDDWHGATPTDGNGILGEPTDCLDAGKTVYNGCGTYVGPESINNAMADRSISDPSHFSQAVKDRHGYNARFLDAYVYGLFPIGDHTLDLRIGRQVISWGESLFLQGGISFAQNRIDAAAATSPGVELKEIFLPSGVVYGQIDLTDSVTMEAYWQYDWAPSELFADGAYFEAQDFLESNILLVNSGVKNNCMFGFTDETTGAPAYYSNNTVSCFTDTKSYIGSGGFNTTPGDKGPADHGFGRENFVDANAMLRAPDVTPDHPADQFGLAFRYLLAGGAEAGLYLIKYHDKYPSLWASNMGAKLENIPTVVSLGTNNANLPGVNTGRYTIQYKEDLQLIGLTLNTVINDVQLGFELTYRHNQPLVPACTQAQLEAGYVVGNGDLVNNNTQAPVPDGQLDVNSAFHSSCKDPSAPFVAVKSGYLTSVPDSGKNWTNPTIAASKLLSWPAQAEVFTYNVGMTYLLPSFPLWDTGFLVGEIGGFYVGDGYQNSDLKMTSIGGFTKAGNGISFIFLPQYKNILEGVDLTLPFFVKYTIDGSFSYFDYNEHALWYSVGAEAVYLSSTSFGVVYNAYSGRNNMWRDRDNVAFNVKYTF